MVTVPGGASKCGPLRSIHCHLKRKRQIMDAGRTKQCAAALKRLMNHEAGWVFNQPVDPVALNIPDYFDVISEPMDLGTIKSKLETGSYSEPQEFAADVRLAFSNAMRYNPPANPVHIMAMELNNIFNMRWKSLDARWQEESLVTLQKPVSKERQNPTNNSRQMGHKTSVPQSLNSSEKKESLRKDLRAVSDGKMLGCLPTSRQLGHIVPITRSLMTSAEKQKLRKNLTALSNGKMPDPVLKFLKRFGTVGQYKGRFEIDIDVFDEETTRELHRIVKNCLEARSVEPRGVEYSGNAQRPFSVNCLKKRFADLDCERSSRKESPTSAFSLDHLACYSNTTGCTERGKSNASGDEGAASVAEGEHFHPIYSLSVRSGTCEEDFCYLGSRDFIYDEQLSPSKALRAAKLKSRFADTILKAQQKTLLSHGEKGDPVKMQQEREKLERQQQEEKARIEAQVKAAEAAARLKAETEMKLRREREREAARLALQKMQKTVEIDENREILKDLEMLRYSQASDLDTLLTSSHGSIDGFLGNPLERLGLFIKDENLEEEDEELVGDVEEGEIGCSK